MSNLIIMFTILSLLYSSIKCTFGDSDKQFVDVAHTHATTESEYQTFASIGFSDNLIGHAVSQNTTPGNLIVYFSQNQNIDLYTPYVKTNSDQTYEKIEACKVDQDKMMVLVKINDTSDSENTNQIISALLFDSTNGALISEKNIVEKTADGFGQYANCFQMESGEVLITVLYRNTQYTLETSLPGYIKYDINNNVLSDMKTIGDASDPNAYIYEIPVSMKLNSNQFITTYFQLPKIRAQIINNDLTLSGNEAELFEYPDNSADYRVQLVSMDNGSDFFMNMYSNQGSYTSKIFKFNSKFEQLGIYENSLLKTRIEYSAFSRRVYVVNSDKNFKLYGTILKSSDLSEINSQVEITDTAFFQGDTRLALTENSAQTQSYIQIYYPVYFEGSKYKMNTSKFSLTKFVPVACADFCKNCNDETGVCIECNDNSNRKINGDGSQCICNDGFEENSGAEVCKLTCNSQCASCDNVITCLTCLDGSAIGEYCYTEIPGKYPVIDQVNGNVTYQDCFSRCATCDNGNTCLTCKEDDQEGSLCVAQKTGMLAVVGQDGSISYQQCDAKCSECDGSVGNCSACKIDSNRDINTNCACNQGFKESDQGECEEIKQEIQCGEKQYKELGVCKFCYYLDSDILEKQCLKGKCPGEYVINHSQYLCIRQSYQKEKKEEEKSSILPVIIIIVVLAVVFPVAGTLIYKKIKFNRQNGIKTFDIGNKKNSKPDRDIQKYDIECHSSNGHSDNGSE